MNAAVMASGHAHGGADGAKAALEAFWKTVSDAAKFSPLRRGPLEMLTGRWTLENSPMFMAAEFAIAHLFALRHQPLGHQPARQDPGQTWISRP